MRFTVALELENVVEEIQSAHSIILTTHKQPDGDGLGSCMAMFHALKKIGKNVRIITVDEVSKKYNFLNTKKYIDVFLNPHKPISQADLTLIFDTNDYRLVDPLFNELSEKSKSVIFVDHHPPLSYGTLYHKSFIDTQVTSTGEIVYELVDKLKIRMDRNIARAIYTSLVFDSYLFRYMNRPSHTHSICAELLKYETEPSEIHDQLFGTDSFRKMNFMGVIFSKVELHFGSKLAIFSVTQDQLKEYGLAYNDMYDILDLVVNVHEVSCVVMLREERPNEYKLSFRSKPNLEVLSLAEHFKGGGHFFASGATVMGDPETIKKQIIEVLEPRLENGETVKRHKYR